MLHYFLETFVRAMLFTNVWIYITEVHELFTNSYLTLCKARNRLRYFENFMVNNSLIPDDGDSTYLWNVGRQLLYTVVHPRR
jgi:hypothetical protein